MMDIRRMRLTAAAGAVACTVLLAGCQGGNNEPDAQASTSDTPSPTASDTPTPTPEATDESSGGGSSKADLDAFVAQGRQALKSMMTKEMTKTFSSIKIEPDYPSGITYVYVFRNAVDPDTAAKQLESSAAMLKGTFTQTVGPALESQGFANPSATWTYENPDGSVLWSKTYR
jgi:hypothetical protein